MPEATSPARGFLAKITRPGYSDVFLRERLFQRLDESEQRLTWISAPPGAGKTTLASSYLVERELPHLWYQLDTGDDDAGTFFHYLGLAARAAAPHARAALPHLTAEYLAGLRVFARRYFEALAAQLEPPFVLEHGRAGRPPQASPDGNPQVLFDHFAAEIFARLDAQTREVLLASALLPKMSAAMVAELTGVASAGGMLEELHRKNYFTLRHAQAEASYEYHPLFRDFLLRRAGLTFTGVELRALRLKAAALAEADGQLDTAAELLRACGDYDGMAQLVLRHARTLVEQGRGQVVEAWITSLAPDTRAANPWLSYWYGVCRLPFAPGEAREHFELAYERWLAEEDLDGAALAWCAIVDSFVFEWGNFKPLARWLEEMQRVLAAKPAFANVEIEAQVTCAMFLALMYCQPEHQDMRQWEQRVRQIILHG